MNAGPYSWMIGKVLWFWSDGHRSGRVVRVNAGKRVGLRAVRVRLPSYAGPRGVEFQGRALTVTPANLRGELAGVLVRGRLRAVSPACESGGAR
jgi:hypothetical protein